MIDALVFSRDRPAQLWLLLDSIERYAPGLYSRVDVLWTGSGPDYDRGYSMLALRAHAFPFELCYRHEGLGTFRADVLDWLDECDHAGHECAFLVDDLVWYRSPPNGATYRCYRLGSNVDYCYPLDREQEPPGSHAITGTWHWDVADGDWGYPLSLDANVYRPGTLLELLDGAAFVDPNTLELALHNRRGRYPVDVLSAPPLSCVVSIAANRVNRTVRNRAGEVELEQPAVLLARFLAGDRLDLDALDFTDVRSCHAEIPLEWKGSS